MPTLKSQGRALASGLPAQIRGQANALVANLPDINLPPLPGFGGGFPTPFAALRRAENALPAGTPRLSTVLEGTPGASNLERRDSTYRPIGSTTTRSSGGRRAGGYRSI